MVALSRLNVRPVFTTESVNASEAPLRTLTAPPLAPSALSFFAMSAPPLTVSPPPKLLLPVSVSVPEPFLVVHRLR